MTLIACTLNHKVPFLTSDILMSSKVGNPNFSIPTNPFDVIPFLPQENLLKPDSFAQKMYIIRDNICVIFAGCEHEIVEFLQEFRQRCSYYPSVRASHVGEFLQEYNLNVKFSKSALFILIIEHIGEDSIHVGMFNYPKEMSNWKDQGHEAWQYLENDVFEMVYATGSGRDNFLNVIDQPVKFTTKHRKGDIWYAIQTNVSLIAKLLALEKINLYTLMKNWGGGFESAFYNGKTFEKIRDLAYIAAYKQFETDGEIDIPFPQLILYYTYISSKLRIVALEINKAKRELSGDKLIISSEAPDFEFRYFDVPGFDDGPDELVLPDALSFKTDRVAVGYSLIAPDNSVFNPCWFNRHPELSVSYTHGKRIELIFSKDVNDTLRDQCKEYFRRNY